MKKLLIFLFLLFFTHVFIYAQTQFTGTVLDASTNEPIPTVNVFLSGTTIGTQTLADGGYSFQANVEGEFTLIASFLGYASESKTVTLEPNKKINIDFRLEVKPLELDEIIVSSSNKEWKRILAHFENFFIGNEQFSDLTYFQNPEILNFDGPDNSGLITVTSDEPLIITNAGLGYTIEADLVDVSFYSDDYLGVYKIHSRFIELSTSSSNREKQWIRNRQLAFEGSATHFFKSVVESKMKKEKFTIISPGGKIEKVRNEQILERFYPLRWQAISKKFDVFELINNPITIGYKVQYNQLGFIEDEHNLSAITYATDTPFILINKKGVLYNPDNIQTGGKWSRERISLLLPVDYKYKSE